MSFKNLFIITLLLFAGTTLFISCEKEVVEPQPKEKVDPNEPENPLCDGKITLNSNFVNIDEGRQGLFI